MVERAMIQKARDDFARSWLAPALNLVQPATILSILLFMSGLLFQSWQLALSEGREFLSVGASAVSTIIVTTLIGLVLVCLAHAVYYRQSPLPSPFVTSFRKIVRGVPAKYVEDDLEEKRESIKHLPELVERTQDPTRLDALAPVLRSCMIESRNISGNEERYSAYLHDCVPAILKILDSGTSVASKLIMSAITKDHFIQPSRTIAGGNARIERDIIVSAWRLLEPFEELYLQALNNKAPYRSTHLEAYITWLCHGLHCVLSKEIDTLHERFRESNTSSRIITLVRLCSWLACIDKKLPDERAGAGPIIEYMRYVVELESRLDPSSLSVAKEDIAPFFHCFYFSGRGNTTLEWLNRFIDHLVVSHGLDILCAFADASLLGGAKDEEVPLKLLRHLMKHIIVTRSMSISPNMALTTLVEYLIRWSNAVFNDAEGADVAVDLNVKPESQLSTRQHRVMELVGMVLYIFYLLASKQYNQKLSVLVDKNTLLQFLDDSKRRFEMIVESNEATSIVMYCQHCYKRLNGMYPLYIDALPAEEAA
jgi:hypothetical protein